MRKFIKKYKAVFLSLFAMGSFGLLSSSSTEVEDEKDDVIIEETKKDTPDTPDWNNSEFFKIYLPAHDRALNAQEKEMVQGVLGKSSDVEGIRIVSFTYDVHDYNGAEFWRDNKNFIYMDDKFYSDNFATEKDVERLGVFMERLVLLRQNREGVAWPRDARVDVTGQYQYNLDQNKSLSGYGRFQQAAMIADYAQRFVHPSHNGIADCQNDNILMQTIEREFSSAAHYRQALPPPKKTELFTAEEIELAHAIFGDEIDVSRTRKYYSKRKCIGADIFTSVNGALYFHGEEYFHDNYALVQDDDLWGAFVHELTHIWQLQQNGMMDAQPLGGDRHRYHYDLQAHKSFEDYTIEQQGEIIRHYAVIFLRNGGAARAYDQDKNLLTVTVENRFPQAAISRKNFAETGRLTARRNPRTGFNRF